jgi:tetratricopeptide (TPR) repeat protein
MDLEKKREDTRLHGIFLKRLQEGDLGEAVRLAEKLEERKYRNSDQAYEIIGIYLIGKECPKEASKYLKKAVELNPENTEAFVHLAESYDGRGWSRQAIDAYKKALRTKNLTVEKRVSIMRAAAELCKDSLIYGELWRFENALVMEKLK